MTHALAGCRTPAHLAPIVHSSPIVGPIRPDQIVCDGSQDGRVEHSPSARPIVTVERTPITENVHQVRLYVPRESV